MLRFFTYSFLQSLSVAIAQLAQMMIAAWYLSPSAVGTWAILQMLYRLLTPFVEGGWTRAVIREKDLNQTQKNTLFSYNIALSVFLYILILLTSKNIAFFFQTPDLQLLICIFCLLYFCVGIGSFSYVHLQKKQAFELIAKIIIATTLLEFLGFLLLLHKGFGIWALCIPFLIKISVQYLCFYVADKQKLRLSNNFQSVKPIILSGNYDLGAQLLNYFYTNIDNLFVGHFLGKEALGIYTLAWDLTVKPAAFLNPIILRIVYPIMANSSKMIAIFKKTVLVITSFQSLIYSALFVASPTLIPLLYGEKWAVSVPIIQILCGVAWLRAVAEPGASFLAATGQFKIEFYFQIFNTFVTVCCLSIVYMFFNIELKNIAWAILIAHGCIVSSWFFIIRKEMKSKALKIE